MKVLLRKIHYPFICFCKSSSSQIYKSVPLKLENGSIPPQQLSVSEDDVVGAAIGNGQKNAENEEENENENEKEEDSTSISSTQNHRPNGGALKSSLRNPSELDILHPAHTQKKKVQWLDFLGKELAEIREFEASEAGDTEYEGVGSRGCVCSIL